MYEIARSKGVLDGPHCETYCCNFVNEDMQLPPTAKKCTQWAAISFLCAKIHRSRPGTKNKLTLTQVSSVGISEISSHASNLAKEVLMNRQQSTPHQFSWLRCIFTRHFHYQRIIFCGKMRNFVR